MLGTAGIGRHVGQVDLGLAGRAELDLRLLGGFLQALERLLVLAQVDPLVLLELGQEPLDHPLVEVVPTEVGVAIRRLHFKDAVAELQDRDVECATAQVVDGDLLVGLLVETVGQGRRGRLVNDSLHLEAGDPTGVLGRLALGVIEIGRNRDHRLGDLLAEVRLGVRLELLEDHRTELRRRVRLVRGDHDEPVTLGVLLDLVRHQFQRALCLRVVPATAHEALDGVDRVGGVGHGLTLGELANEPLASLGEGNDRGNGSATLGRGDHGRLAALHDGHHGVGRSQIDPDDLAHGC